MPSGRDVVLTDVQVPPHAGPEYGEGVVVVQAPFDVHGVGGEGSLHDPVAEVAQAAEGVL